MNNEWPWECRMHLLYFGFPALPWPLHKTFFHTSCPWTSQIINKIIFQPPLLLHQPRVSMTVLLYLHFLFALWLWTSLIVLLPTWIMHPLFLLTSTRQNHKEKVLFLSFMLSPSMMFQAPKLNNIKFKWRIVWYCCQYVLQLTSSSYWFAQLVTSLNILGADATIAGILCP